MCQFLDESADALLGVRFTALTASDHAQLRDRLERTCAQHGRARLLLWFDGLDDEDATAVWDALALGDALVDCLERLAVAGAAWTEDLLGLAGHTGPFEGRHFEAHERGAAWRWLSGAMPPPPSWARTDAPAASAASPTGAPASVPGLPPALNRAAGTG